LKSDVRQSIDFSNCLHIFDDEILLPRSTVEKRHQIYKQLATSISYDYFGNQAWEETTQDAWLVQSINERIGDHYLRLKCGPSFFRYQVAKRIKRFFKLVRANAERFSINSKFVPHFSELQYGEDLFFLKCQLIMHIIDQLLGETHFYNVARELFRKSKQLINLTLFKKLLRDIGVKFFDIQSNWIDSTSCPEIECSFSFNRKNNSVDIQLE
jgi:hypothetical protein